MKQEDNFPYLDPNKIDEAFVMDSYREGQKEVIEYAVEKLNSGKKFIILECPTGSGKSAIGMTLCGMVNDSYYLTITKILQDQLSRDFDDIVLLKGRNAYPCTFYDLHGNMLVDRKVYTVAQLNKKKDEKPSCNEGFCKVIKASASAALSMGKGQCTKCFLAGHLQPHSKHLLPRGDQSSIGNNRYSSCPYFEQVYQAINSKKVSMNFTSFIYQTSLTKRFDKPRDLIIIDEAHNIEQQVLDYVSITINDDMLKDHGYYIPEFKNAKDYQAWFTDIKIDDILAEIKRLAEIGNDQDKVDDIDRLILKLGVFRMHIGKEGSEWVVDYKTETGRDNKSMRSVSLKPVFATGLVDDIIFKFGKRIVLLSATILDVDVMCKSLGVRREEVAAYRMKNRFPKENRPIFIKPAAKMVGGKDKMQEWLPKLVKAVEEIILQYPNKRGIIHTHNFAILDAIANTKNNAVSRRILTQREFPNKSDLLEYHSRQLDSVIVAPAMHEGVDLNGDLSRFQVICKVPYANFYENPQLARRVEVDPRYYDWMTALKLIQSYGRSIRSADDYADTYIIDEAIINFLKKAKAMIPQWFTEAIKY